MRILTTTFAALWLATPTLAQVCEGVDLFTELTDVERSEIADATADIPFATGTLFTATRGEQTVTVVGTLHVPDPRHVETLARLREAFDDAELLVLEATGADEARLLEMTTSQPDLFFLTDGPSLIDMLGEEDWAIARQRFEELGIPGFFAAKFRPWYAGLVMGMPPCMVAEMAKGATGLDRLLEVMAEREGIEVAAIEDARAIVSAMAGGDDEDDARMLRLSLRTDMSGNDMTHTLIQRYFDGRVAEFMEFARMATIRDMPDGGEAAFDEFLDALLIERNAAWEADMPGVIGDRDAVFAVGAAHLAGETGVLRALERQGFTVAPLK